MGGARKFDIRPIDAAIVAAVFAVNFCSSLSEFLKRQVDTSINLPDPYQA